MKRELVLAWLAQRRPERPAELAARMDGAVDEMDPADLARAATMADALASLGLAMLSQVTARSSRDLCDESERDGVALGLLAADAFVTYAFEAAWEERAEVAPLVNRLLEEAA